MNKELNAAEAVYGFVGWLTSREERTVMSAKDDCAPIAELIKRFCTENNLPEVSDQWPLNLIHPSGEVAVPNAEIALLKRSLLDAEAAAPQPSPTPQADSTPAAICNACGAELLEVKQSPNSYLSAEQFDADKLGDWYCKCCPKGPSEGSSTHRYFWNRDLGAAAPQADSQPAPEYIGNGMFKGETIEKAAEHWSNWCDVRCMTGLSEFLRVVAARAPADSVTAPAATPTAASIAWTALRDLTDPLGEAGVKIMGHVRIYAQRQYEAGLTEGRATPPTQAANSVLEDAAPGIDAAFEAVRRGLCKLPRYSFYIDTGGGVRKVGDRIGKWIEFDEAHALFDPISVDAARKQGANHD